MTCRWQGALVVLALLALLAITAGCTETPAEDRCRVADDGRLSLSLAGGGDRSIEVLERDGNFSLSRAVFSSGGVPVTAYIGAPARPAAVGIVYVPGANEPVSGHRDRFRRYADAGIAFLYLDVRGNGFETPGARTDLGAEYREFERGGFPQSYRVIADILRARALLAEEFGPATTWAVGSSNGGRYAAVAAAIEPAFAGYAGVSTSGYGDLSGLDAGPRQFIASLDPASMIGVISPRPVLVYHAGADPVIPFADGEALFEAARDPRTFVPFSGQHGIDPVVDADLIGRLTQVYGR
ncbi:hypothetical protein DSECCO2_264100 [anaerobic digester metagenome]